MTTQPKILPSLDFDTGTVTATASIKTKMIEILKSAKRAGLDIEALLEAAKTATQDTAENILNELHEVATLLFLQWQCAYQSQDITETLAVARIFNGITHRARELNRCHSIIDFAHLDELKATLQNEFNLPDYDPASTAKALEIAAKKHTHEKAWLWVVLPTFRRQPYGRILLFKIDLPDSHASVFVTQPFFLSGKVTLFHTHGYNWAFSRPLGNPTNGTINTHINTMWTPRSSDEPFPLVQLDLAEYCCDGVVALPPRTIHGISRRRKRTHPAPTFTDLIQNKADYRDLIDSTRFGEMACMHIYRPDMSLVDDLESCPILNEDERFFIENDMIVFDHLKKSIWAGGGGSWSRRMVEFGTTGDHCGLCFEDDPRRENLNPQLVSDWLVQSPSPQVQVFKSEL